MFFKGVSKIWRYLISAKLKWSLPRQSDVLVYDAGGQEILLEYLKPWNPEVLHVRGEQIYLRLLFSSLFRREARRDAYEDCFIEKVRPRLIVTFIDNNWHFYTISQRHPEVKTLVVQNGWRTRYPGFGVFEEMDFDASSIYFVDYMLLFGSVTAEKYAQYIKGNIVLMGSIKNNYKPKEKLPERGIMAFLSSWDPVGITVAGVFITKEEDYPGKVDRPVIQCLVRYAEEKKKRLMIIPRNPKGSELRVQEEAYYRELMGCGPEFLESKEPYSSYSAVDYAEVVVTIDSTLGYESIARGNKTAIFSLRSKLFQSWKGDFGWPKEFQGEGPFWTMTPDPDSFVRILDHLFEIDDIQWSKVTEAINFSSYMIYDPGNSILKKTLKKVLDAPRDLEH
jgi:surface carbohydrate biosynthesis protein